METFAFLSQLIAYSAEFSGFTELKLSLLLTREFMDQQDKYAALFIDLAAIAFLKKSMKPYWYEQGKDVGKVNGWSSNIENEIRNACEQSLRTALYRRCARM